MHSRHARNSYDPKLKRIFQITWSFFEIFPFIRFGIAWTGRINLKFFWGYDIKYLSIWAFMRYPCFLTEKVSKVTFILFCQKNSHGLFHVRSLVCTCACAHTPSQLTPWKLLSFKYWYPVPSHTAYIWIWMAFWPGITSDAFQVCLEMIRSQIKKNFWNRASRFWENHIYPLLST
jgi:hypothetical protein